MENPFQNQGDALPELGVGITYSSELESLLTAEPGLVQLLEIEPQTLWLRDGSSAVSYKIPDALFEHLGNLPVHKLIHGVGMPVGGVFRPDEGQLTLFDATIRRLGAPWASEHLSFNATMEHHTGFFLPPPQTDQGVEIAVQSIQRLSNRISVPLAVETGVNYLKPRSNEMPDGEFVRRVVEKADCGLLLDLHNLFCNQLNGRQSILEYVQQIPCERVWEIHLAGGFEMDGFYLDAHSGVMPDALKKIAAEVIPLFPNLRAIVYEILPSYLPSIGMQQLVNEIEAVHKIWEKRKTSKSSGTNPSAMVMPKQKPQTIHPLPESQPWEETLGGLIAGKDLPVSTLLQELSEDPGVAILQKLAKEFRASMLVTVFPKTSTFLMLTIGVEGFSVILDDFWKKYPPHQFASDEGLQFATYLAEMNFEIPNLGNLIAFEEATLKCLLDGNNRVVTFDHDPFPLLRALTENRMPENLQRQSGIYEIEITADDWNQSASQIKSIGYS